MSGFCELAEACCMKHGETNLNPSTCKAQLQLLGFSRDANLQAACLAELRQLGANGNCFWDVGNLNDPCARIFNEPSGAIPPGGNCRTSMDCAGVAGAITSCWANSGSGGVCMRMSRGSAGQGTCLGDAVTTGGFLGPFFGPGSSVWPPAVVDGVFCDQRAGLTCIPNDDLNAQVCAPFLADGAPCLFGFNCASEICWDPSYGEVNGERPGVCMRRIGDGQACSISANVTCDRSSYCNAGASGNGVCAPRGPDGAACSSNDACENANCELSTTTCSGIPLVAATYYCK